MLSAALRGRTYTPCVATQTDTAWARWLRTRLDERGWTQTALTQATGEIFDSSRVSRWLREGQTPDMRSVRAVCSAFGVPAVEGMIAAGYLLPEDVGAKITQRLDPGELSNRELLAEVERRLEAVTDGATVRPIESARRGTRVRTAARRRPDDATSD